MNLIKNINGRVIELEENSSLNKSLVNVNNPEDYKNLK